MLERLIVARHGDPFKKYSPKEGHLSPSGKIQMERLRDSLASYFRGKTVIVLSSPTHRTKESALILCVAEPANYRVELDDALAMDQYGCEDCDEILRLVRSFGEHCEVLVLVTHKPAVEEFPNHFAHAELSVARETLVLTGESRLYGEARTVDCIGGRHEHVRIL